MTAGRGLQGGLSLEPEHDPGPGPGDRPARGRGIGAVPELGDGELEVVDRGVIGDRGGVLPFRGDAQRRCGRDADALEHLVGVDPLGRQSRAQDVVAGGHDLQAGAVEVGVQRPRGHEHRLTGLQRHRVQQQRRDHTRVPRMVLRQQRDEAIHARGRRGAGRRPGTAGLDHRVDRLGRRPQRGGDQGPERGAHAVRGGVVHQQGVQPVGQRRAQPVEDHRRPARGAEAAQRGEAGQGDQHLGLVVRVAVGAQRRVQGDAGRALGGEGLRRVLPGGVHLQRQRRLRGDHLEQVRQLPVEGTGHVRAEHPLTVRGDDRVQPSAVGRGRGGERMRSEPGLRPGPAVGCTAQELRDRGGRSPAVVLGVAGELEQAHAPPSRIWAIRRAGSSVPSSGAGVGSVPARRMP